MKKEDVKMRPGGFNENKTYAAKKKPEESNNGRKWRNKKLETARRAAKDALHREQDREQRL